MSEEIVEEIIEEVIEEVASPEVIESSEIAPEETAAAIGEEPAYAPDFSYKFKDEDRAFDERFHGVIKSKDDEDYLRNLYTKADGLDTYKGKYTDLEGQTEALLSGYRNLEGLQKAGDVAGVQKLFKFEDEAILRRAEEILQHQELPEDQRNLIDNNARMQSEIDQMRQQFETTQTNTRNQVIQEDIAQMQGLIMNEYSDVAKAMQADGKDMAWMVGALGSSYYQRDGVEPSVESVVKEVALMHRHLVTQQPVAQAQATNIGTQAPTIPSLQGNTVNPVKPAIRSIDDLRKLAASIPSR